MGKAVELLYFEGCPTYKTTLKDLEEMVKQEALDARIVLIRIESEEDAKKLRFLGSPTVRVDGVDVDQTARESSDFGLRCRIYRVDGRMLGSPSRETLGRALKGGPA
ncbi:MAG: hypothetical protein JRM85_01440 [Nitrososphaerota archaeon]|nr:hypothetical protein [Nitrososphaerota archaeon]MDG6946684.1 hypothetical protein [Nitrososphaerota archaeon]